MAVKTPSPARAADPAKQQPPDERFWVKYSRHHELPISSMASLAWHVFLGVLIVVVALVVAGSRDPDMPIETIAFAGGGGGSPEGVGPASGIGETAGLQEKASAEETPRENRPVETPSDVPALQIQPADLLKELPIDPESERVVPKLDERASQAEQRLANANKRINTLLGSAGAGRGGRGSGGGLGGGLGAGTGDGQGEGGKLNQRTKRKLRWTLIFNTASGHDYLRQLQVIGAILAFRQPDGEVKVVKDLLRRPVQLESEDLQKLNRIFWYDDRRESVEQLMRALGLDFVPDKIFALFPYDFEQELLRKELDYQNRQEDDIAETRFEIRMRGRGRYDVRVMDQRLR